MTLQISFSLKPHILRSLETFSKVRILKSLTSWNWHGWRLEPPWTKLRSIRETWIAKFLSSKNSSKATQKRSHPCKRLRVLCSLRDAHNFKALGDRQILKCTEIWLAMAIWIIIWWKMMMKASGACRLTLRRLENSLFKKTNDSSRKLGNSWCRAEVNSL